MALILHLESSTELCSVAISNGTKCLFEKNSVKDYSHSKLITTFIQESLDKAGKSLNELEAIAISNGPGSYTGLRVGNSVAKGLCYALGIPLIAVSTLHALAFPQYQDGFDLIMPMLDARRMEVYTCIIDKDYQKVRPDFNQILDYDFINELISLKKRIIFCGNGSFKLNELNLEELDFKQLNTPCFASNMVFLANKAFENQDFVDLAYHEPYYLKSANITTPKKML